MGMYWRSITYYIGYEVGRLNVRPIALSGTTISIIMLRARSNRPLPLKGWIGCARGGDILRLAIT